MSSKEFVFLLLAILSCLDFAYNEDGENFKNYANSSDILHVLTNMEHSVSEAIKSIHADEENLQQNETETLIDQYTNFLKHVMAENQTVLVERLLETYSSLGKNLTNSTLENPTIHNPPESDDYLEKYIEMLEKEKSEVND